MKHDWKNPGWFRKGYVVDARAYRKKKRDATQVVMGGDYDPWLSRDTWILNAKNELKLTNKKIGKIFGVSGERIRQIMAERLQTNATN
ncbi:hypothetical protein GOV10_04165 [Candidatus Woesearchaeota archaeon]|nr:hypothetical protein [Candidatus Woesearchaeota archaeon]